MKVFEFQGQPMWRLEDGGAAIIGEASGDDSDTGMWVRIHSWDPGLDHSQISRLQGQNLRVTIEIIP
jgi:hypothetical protein